MSLIVDAKKLASALKALKPMARRHRQICLYKHQESPTLSVYASDGSNLLQMILDAEGEIDCILGYWELLPFATSGPMTITKLHSNNVQIETGNLWAKLLCCNPDEEVKLTNPVGVLSECLTVWEDQYIDMCSLIPMAGLWHPSRVLGRICIRGSHMMVTDTHRAAVLQNDEKYCDEQDRYIPVDFLTLLRSALPKRFSHVEFQWFEDNYIRANVFPTSGSICATLTMNADLTGQFPDVIGKACNYQPDGFTDVTFKTAEVIEAINTLVKVASEHRICFDFWPVELDLTLSTPFATVDTIAHVGATANRVDFLGVNDDSFREPLTDSISLNGHYLLDALRFLDAEEVTMRVRGLLEPVQMEANCKTVVIMPMSFE